MIKPIKDSTQFDQLLKFIYINESIFIGLVFLCLTGEMIVEFAERIALFYWLFVTPVFFYCSWLSEKAHYFKTGQRNENFLKYGMIFWGSAMVAVVLIFLMWHTEIIRPEGAATSIHILLAHTMILSGVVLGSQFYLIGGLLFITATLNILFEEEFGFDMMISIPFIWYGFYLEKMYLFPNLKRKLSTDDDK